MTIGLTRRLFAAGLRAAAGAAAQLKHWGTLIRQAGIKPEQGAWCRR